MDVEWSERTGVEELDDQLNPLKKWGWPRNMPSVSPEATEPTGDSPGRKPANRIHDDMKTQGNSSSGGPGGLYADMRAHEASLREELGKAEAPMPRPDMKRRLLTALSDAGPTILAAKFGGAGGAVGADQRMEEGVKRRQSEYDLEKKRRAEKATQLRGEIEATERGTLQAEIGERGLNERARLQRESEDARAKNLEQTLAQRDRAITERGDVQAGLEDKRQKGRMELQRDKDQNAVRVANIHAAAAQGKVPPPVARAADDYETSQSRIDVMQKSYDAAIQDPGNQQAMLNLLANHLGMTMGLQKGARMNQAIIEEAYRSGYLTERVEAHFGPDGYMTGVVLTPRQMGQMMGLAQDRMLEDARRMQEWEAYTGFKPAKPMTPRVPPKGDGAGGGGGGATGAADQLKPPTPATKGMKWQHRISNGKVEWRMVPDNKQAQ